MPPRGTAVQGRLHEVVQRDVKSQIWGGATSGAEGTVAGRGAGAALEVVTLPHRLLRCVLCPARPR